MSLDASSLECPICCLLMTPPGRNPMTLNCGHTICETCLYALNKLECPLCKTQITSQAKSRLLCELIAKYIKTHDVQEETNPRSEPIVTLCTAAQNGPRYIEQKWYQCKTCKLIGKLGCCEACARRCHQGHDCVYVGVVEKAYCDCGTGRAPKPCSCLGNAATCNTCTYFYLGRQFIGQRFYQCLTCRLPDPMGCCEVCARVCHAGHNIKLLDRSIPIGDCDSFCDCGESGHCICCQHEQPVACLKDEAPLLFHCLSCDLFCCGYCADICHADHLLTFEGVNANRSCHCQCRKPAPKPRARL